MNIIITGASKGIGRELAKIFCGAENNKVLAVSRSSEILHEMEEEFRESPSVLNVFPFDLSSEDLTPLMDFIGKIMPQVDILVNNAGKLVNKPFREISSEDFDQIFSTNVKAPFRLAQALVDSMASDGHIVNIGSMGGFQGSAKFPGLSLYSASKGALAILTECMAEELSEKGIKVNCLALGSAQTEMLETAFPGYRAPLSAGEMANYIAWFSMEGHKYFNGKVLPVSSSTP